MQKENEKQQTVGFENLKFINTLQTQQVLSNLMKNLQTSKMRLDILAKKVEEKSNLIHLNKGNISNSVKTNDVEVENNKNNAELEVKEELNDKNIIEKTNNQKSPSMVSQRNEKGTDEKDNLARSKQYPNNPNKNYRDNNSMVVKRNFDADKNKQNAKGFENKSNKQFQGYKNGNFNKPFQTANSQQPKNSYAQNNKNKKVLFADTSVLDANKKNKHTNSISKKKIETRRIDENSKPRVTTKNGLSELDLEDNDRFNMGARKKIKKNKDKNSTPACQIKIENAVITTEKVSIKTLSEKIGQPVASIIKKLLILNIMANINTDIDFDTAALISEEFGVKLEHKVEKTADEKLLEEVKAQNKEGNNYKRSPVVTVMGHVDHGKTSLLDAIRNTHVTAGEAGGITQHIGAYTINYKGSNITFIDTPGHEAFSAMRARGASVTDVAILVVAADDGVMPQTKESIAQIKQAGVPMVVAINKIDKNDANPDKIKQQLAECDVMPEEWGGDTVMVNISARNNINIDKLLEMVLLVSEVSDLKCNLDRSAIGTVIEAKLDKGKGPIANVLVQNGTLHVGDTIISGLAVGRVRAMMDDKGKNVKTAGPSTPVSVLGLDRVPNAGDKILAVDEQIAKQVIVDRKNKVQIQKQNAHISMSAEELLKKMENKKPYNLIVKTDVQGSYEALVHMLNSIENEELHVVCVHGGVGAVNETDIDMAIASKARIIAFNTKTESNAKDLAEESGIKIDYYKVIYEVIDDVKKQIKELLTPVYEEKIVGHCEVRVLFKISRIGTVAGCYVLDGKIPKNAQITLKRGNEIIVKTGIVTLQKDKQDVKEVMAGYECGIKLDGFDAIKELDIFEAIVLERVER